MKARTVYFFLFRSFIASPKCVFVCIFCMLCFVSVFLKNTLLVFFWQKFSKFQNAHFTHKSHKTLHFSGFVPCCLSSPTSQIFVSTPWMPVTMNCTALQFTFRFSSHDLLSQLSQGRSEAEARSRFPAERGLPYSPDSPYRTGFWLTVFPAGPKSTVAPLYK